METTHRTLYSYFPVVKSPSKRHPGSSPSSQSFNKSPSSHTNKSPGKRKHIAEIAGIPSAVVLPQNYRYVGALTCCLAHAAKGLALTFRRATAQYMNSAQRTQILPEDVGLPRVSVNATRQVKSLPEQVNKQSRSSLVSSTPQKHTQVTKEVISTPPQPSCLPETLSPTTSAALVAPLTTQECVVPTTPLVCFFTLERMWRNFPTTTLAQEMVLKQPWFGLDLSLLPFHSGTTPGGHKTLAIVPSDYLILKTYLEQSLGVGLPEVATTPISSLSAATTCACPAAFSDLRASITHYNRALEKEERLRSALKASAKHLQKAATAVRHRRKFLCLDVEAYEFNHTVITEIGYTIASYRSNSYVTKTQHIIISETMQFRNGQRVPDHKMAFAFGHSLQLPFAKAIAKLRTALKSVDYVVGHAISSDERFLRKFGISFAGKTIFDTQIMVKTLLNPPSADQLKLSKILDVIGLSYQGVGLHNAGNDSQLTMEAFLAMAMGGYGRFWRGEGATSGEIIMAPCNDDGVIEVDADMNVDDIVYPVESDVVEPELVGDEGVVSGSTEGCVEGENVDSNDDDEGVAASAQEEEEEEGEAMELDDVEMTFGRLALA